MSFSKNVLAVFSAQVLEKFIRQLNSIVLARFLEPSGFGLYSLFFTIAQNFFTFLEFGLGSSGIFHIRRKLNKEKEVIENIVIFSFIMGICSILLILLFKDILISQFLDEPLMIIFLIITIPIIILSSIFSILMRGLKKFNIYNSFVIIKPSFFLIILISGIFFSSLNVLFAIIAQITTIIFSAIFISYKMYKIIPFNISFHNKPFVQNLKYGIKQYVMKISLMLTATSQIFIIKYLTDNSVVGQFSVILSILGLIAFVKNSVSFVLTPKVSELGDKEIHHYIAKICRNVFFITSLSSFIVAVVGSYYVKFFYGASYSFASELFIYFIPGIIFHSACIIIQRYFTNKLNPIQIIPIFAYIVGFILISSSTFILLNKFTTNPLILSGIAYSFSHFIILLILTAFFVFRSKIKLRKLFIIDLDDINYYKKFTHMKLIDYLKKNKF